MARASKVIGAALATLGVAVAVMFGVVMSRDEGFQKAALAAARNPGNVMYDAEFGAAKIRRGFQLVGVVAGILFVLNGTTLVGLGAVASRLGHTPD
jgi:hypothetical protein